MNINRNNYEEYFLLYIDNELSVADKNMVETFVAANPDLQEELVMLQQSIAKPCVVEFTGKEKLLKAESVDADTEEKLLLLLDNELDGKEKEQLAALIQNNKAVKDEWELLQQTKLSPAGIIIFKDKASLYKKEGTKLVPMRWWRIAAAAMLIGFGLWGVVRYSHKETGVVETAGANKHAGSTGTGNTPFVKKTDADDTGKASTVKTTIDKTSPSKISASEDGVKKIIVPKQDKKDDDIVIQEPGNNNDLPVSDNINNNDSNKKIIVHVTPQTQTNKATFTSVIPTTLPNTVAVKTSLTGEIAFDDQDDKPRKTKIGGFFKKVKRVLERNTKIKTGNEDEIRIANVSFAMH